MTESKSPPVDVVKEAMKEGTLKTEEGIKNAMNSAKDVLKNIPWVQIGVGLSLAAAVGYLVCVAYNDVVYMITCPVCTSAEKKANNAGEENSSSSFDKSEDTE